MTDANAQKIQHMINQVTGKILENCEELADEGFPKELFLSGLIFAVANISKQLGVPTAKLGITMSQARQTVDNETLRNRRPV